MPDRNSILPLAALLLFCIGASAQPTPAFIPRPAELSMRQGQFSLDGSVGVRHDPLRKELAPLASFLVSEVERRSGVRMPVNGRPARQIHLRLSDREGIPSEGYRLTVEAGGVYLTASRPAGIFYGMQTLLQCLPAARTNAALRIPAMEVSDRPRFHWRGLHLDVSRHFFPPEVIRDYIDLMAAYKLNVFHWHLTDDPGWRMQVDRYPLLTSVGAWRVDHTDRPYNARPQAKPGEAATYGGFYTKQQLKELVSYARLRNVTIVPEIEMPGHSAAAVASYPNLGCTGKPQLPMTGGDYAGISSNFCAGNDEVFTFLENVLTEVMEVFPSEFIHIGGDEVDKSPWRNCSRCQARMRAHGLRNEEELQSWFIRRIERFLVAHKRKVIGWDEILEGGLAPTAAVMSWRGESGGIAAARLAHEVVMTPGNPCYFDHYQAGPEGEPRAIGGMNTLRRVYAYEPVPAELEADRHRYILGAQANVWTEYIGTAEHLEYMVLPRMPALAEVLWSPKASRDWEGFLARLQPHLRSFEQRGIRYCRGNFKVDITPKPSSGRLTVALSTEAHGGSIRYTLDGSDPTVMSNRYESPVAVEGSGVLKAVAVVNGEVMGVKPAEQAFTFHRAVGAGVSYAQPPARPYMASGLQALTDGVRGIHSVGGHWHGFEGRDMVATVDMGALRRVGSVTLGCLQRYSDWIFMPGGVAVEGSSDGVTYKPLASVPNDVPPDERNSLIRDFKAVFPSTELRYLRVTAKALPGCPKGHPGEGRPAWIFADEIIVE